MINYMIDELKNEAFSELISELAFDPKCVCGGGGGSKAKAPQACLISITAARWNGASKK